MTTRRQFFQALAAGAAVIALPVLATAPPAQIWHHFRVSRESNETKFFLDGVLVENQNQTMVVKHLDGYDEIWKKV